MKKFLILILSAIPLSLISDTLVLKDGRTIENVTVTLKGQAVMSQDCRGKVEKYDKSRLSDWKRLSVQCDGKAAAKMDSEPARTIPEQTQLLTALPKEDGYQIALTLSRDLKRFSHYRISGTDVADKLTIDGAEQTVPPAKFGYEMVFSPDGKRFAYSVFQPGQSFVVLDGSRGPSTSSVSKLRFSPDSASFAYAASVGERGAEYIVLNGAKQKTYMNVGEIVFSGDGAHYGYTAPLQGQNGPDAWRLVIDGREVHGGSYAPNIIFSHDGAHWAAYCIGGYPAPNYLLFDGKRLEHEATGIMIFSPDSKRFAYTAKEGERQFVILDSKRQGDFDFIDGGTPNEDYRKLVFSPDSRRFAYVAEKKKPDRKIFVVLDGIAQKEYSGDVLFHLRFSPNSQRFAYIAQYNTLVVDGHEQKYEQSAISFPIFSPDSKHLAFQAEYVGNRAVVLDGKAMPLQKTIEGKPFFEPGGTLVYASLDEQNRLWRRTVKPK